MLRGMDRAMLEMIQRGSLTKAKIGMLNYVELGDHENSERAWMSQTMID